MTNFFLTALALLPVAFAAPPQAIENRAAAPTVAIAAPVATIIGSSTGSIESFNGIPFAQPPVGGLRLKPPQPLTASLGTVKAVGLAAACPQFLLNANSNDIPLGVLGTILDTPFFQTVTNAKEDCLTINVIRPAGVQAGDNLPVLFWIFGGAFELGSTQMYDGSSLVSEAANTGKPIIFVAVNYRVGGFGFMPGSKILADGSANLGLLDQRLGLQWVADNIANFGGDPDKVTIWGESAGAISVLDHIVLYNGNHTYKNKPLFRAGIMNSGSLIPADPVDCPKGEAVYNQVVAAAGCSSAADSLACLRAADYTTFLNAVNSVPGLLSYNSIALSYFPRPDGVVLTASPDLLIAAGNYAKVPVIIGDQEDEGTIFALFQSNITTTGQIVTYLKDKLFHHASTAQLTNLVATYQDIVVDGSPFRTLFLNNWYPQFKRMAALLGDLSFTLTRRLYLSSISDSVPTWSYLSSYDYGTPILGTFHASDLLQVFYGIVPNYASAAIRNYYFSFVYTMDPNDGSSYMYWPQWQDSNQLMQFFATGATLITDDFRSDTYNFVIGNVGSLYL